MSTTKNTNRGDIKKNYANDHHLGPKDKQEDAPTKAQKRDT